MEGGGKYRGKCSIFLSLLVSLEPHTLCFSLSLAPSLGQTLSYSPSLNRALLLCLVFSNSSKDAPVGQFLGESYLFHLAPTPPLTPTAACWAISLHNPHYNMTISKSSLGGHFCNTPRQLFSVYLNGSSMKSPKQFVKITFQQHISNRQ